MSIAVYFQLFWQYPPFYSIFNHNDTTNMSICESYWFFLNTCVTIAPHLITMVHTRQCQSARPCEVKIWQWKSSATHAYTILSISTSFLSLVIELFTHVACLLSIIKNIVTRCVKWLVMANKLGDQSKKLWYLYLFSSRALGESR